jgi:glycosyltransferase involved in cell wall biosynthesis
VLESMACGTPVVTSNGSSLVEVAGKAALLVDPHSTEQIASALIWLLTDEELRAKLIREGYQQAKRFTWEAAAAQLHALYYRMLE